MRTRFSKASHTLGVADGYFLSAAQVGGTWLVLTLLSRPYNPLVGTGVLIVLGLVTRRRALLIDREGADESTLG